MDSRTMIDEYHAELQRRGLDPNQLDFEQAWDAFRALSEQRVEDLRRAGDIDMLQAEVYATVEDDVPAIHAELKRHVWHYGDDGDWQVVVVCAWYWTAPAELLELPAMSVQGYGPGFERPGELSWAEFAEQVASAPQFARLRTASLPTEGRMSASAL